MRTCPIEYLDNALQYCHVKHAHFCFFLLLIWNLGEGYAMSGCNVLRELTLYLNYLLLLVHRASEVMLLDEKQGNELEIARTNIS